MTDLITTLPLEIWYKIIDYIPNQTMAQLVRLAQTSQEYRIAFLSDLVWAKFDVYETRAVYEYEGYTLRGVAAHFFNHLSKCPKDRQKWFFSGVTDLDLTFISQFDLYAQIKALSLSPFDIDKMESIGMSSEYPIYGLEPFNLKVWKLWATQPLKPARPYTLRTVSCIPDHVLQDKQVFLELVKHINLIDIPPVFEDDWEVNLAMLQYNEPDHFRAHPLQQYKGFVLEALSAIDKSTNYRLNAVVEDICDGWWHDREVVLRAVSVHWCGGVLRFASPEFQADREVVWAAVKNFDGAVRFASEDLRHDREIAMAAVRTSGFNLRYLPEGLRSDPEFVLTALESYDFAVEWAAEPLQSDPDFWLKVARVNSYALAFIVTEPLRSNPEFIAEAVTCAKDLCHLQYWLKNNEAFVWEALRRNDLNVLEMCGQLLANKEITLKVVTENGSALRYVPQELQNDKDVVLAAVRSRKEALQHASQVLQSNRDILNAAS